MAVQITLHATRLQAGSTVAEEYVRTSMKMPSTPAATAVRATVGISSRMPPLATPPPCTRAGRVRAWPHNPDSDLLHARFCANLLYATQTLCSLGGRRHSRNYQTQQKLRAQANC